MTGWNLLERCHLLSLQRQRRMPALSIQEMQNGMELRIYIYNYRISARYGSTIIQLILTVYIVHIVQDRHIPDSGIQNPEINVLKVLIHYHSLSRVMTDLRIIYPDTILLEMSYDIVQYYS